MTAHALKGRALRRGRYGRVRIEADSDE
jgi:hypothetical protein